MHMCQTVVISKTIGRIFRKLAALVHFGTEIRASDFGFKRSKFKVTVVQNMLEIER